MAPGPLDRRNVTIRVLYCWIAFMFVALSGSHVSSLMYGGPPLSRVAILTGIVDVLAGVVIATICFGNWSSFVSMRVPKLAATLLFATTALAAVQNVVISTATGRPLTFNRFGALFHPALTDMGVLFGIGYGIQVFEAHRRRELSEARLETELARAQVQLLRAQLQPHFLFNSLHAIAGRVATSPSKAQTMIARLGDLLRMSTDTAVQSRASLRDELRFIGAYLDLQKFRYEERMQVTIDVAEETLDSDVPSFILQPAVENAVRHAVECVEDVVQLGISAAFEGDALVLQVWNNGPALRPDATMGVGLRNTIARVAYLYGERGSVSLRDRAEGGVVTEIRIPCSAPVLAAAG